MGRFQNAIRDAAALVDSKSLAMAGSFLKAQTEIVGGFAAIGSAAVGLVDHVANADQEFRLLGMHMYMSKDAARSLKITMDALGQPLENLAWDPELRERAARLIELQRNAAPGGDFEAQMHKVRAIRNEFAGMEVEVQYLGMHVVQDFMKALGMGPDDLLAKLRGFNDWVSTRMPEISRHIVNDFLPVWRNVVEVLKATGEAAKQGVIVFTNLVGLLSGDTSIQGTALSLDNLSTALQHVSGGFASFGMLFAHIEELLSHVLVAMNLIGHGKFTEAGAELKAGAASLSAEEWLTVVGAVGGTVLGGPLGGVVGAGLAYGVTSALDHGGAHDVVDRAARAQGVDPVLLHALAKVESGESQFGPDGRVLQSATSSARGIMQLLAGTAKSLGVNPDDINQNAAGGAHLLKTLLDRYGSVPTAIAAWHEGEPKMQRILAGKDSLSPEAYAEVAKVMRLTGTHGDVHIGSIVVHVDKKNAVNEDVADVVVARLRAMQGKSMQRNQLEFQSVGTY